MAFFRQDSEADVDLAPAPRSPGAGAWTGACGSAETQQALASLLEAEGRPREATALLAGALPVYRAVPGSAHGSTAERMTNLAALKRAGGDAAAASARHRDALVMEQERLGSEHPRVAALRAELRACLTVLGRYDEAERHVQASPAALVSQGNQDGQAYIVLELFVALYERAESQNQPARTERTSLHRLADAVVQRASITATAPVRADVSEQRPRSPRPAQGARWTSEMPEAIAEPAAAG